MSKVKEKAEPLAKNVAQQLGVALVATEYVKTAHGMCLNIYIDKEGGASLDDTTNFARAIGSMLDENDVTCGAQYTLNVSSKGAYKPKQNFNKKEGNE